MASDLIEHNPAFKNSLLSVLALCAQSGSAERATVEQAAWDLWDETFHRTPGIAIDVLVRNGALVEQVFADGEPYEGTLEDMQLDESIADDTVAAVLLSITDEGRELLERYAPERTLRELFDTHPAYVDVYEAVLRACSVQGGCSRMSLEARINEFPQLKPDLKTNRTKVYPQYFIDALEAAGGIAWSGSWCATDAGKAAVSA